MIAEDVKTVATYDTVVALRGVCRYFQEGAQVRRALDGVDLEIESGSCVALLGRSGSGKSTLLNLISGIDLATAGEVRVAGHDMSRLNDRQRTLFRRRHIGFVYQFFNLIPTLTVAENLLLPLHLNGLGVQPARELLDQVGLGDRGDAFPDRLSGGEQQRVAIARALVHAPSLLLADEPTGNLDAATGRQVLDLLERLTRDSARTLILVTHSRAVAERADRIHVLENGRITTPGAEVAW